MKVKDPILWQNQVIELQADETSRKFLAFLEKWLAAAEGEIASAELGWGDDDAVVIGAVRNAYYETERELGYLSMEFIGQMLLIASQHWEYAEPLLAGMSVFEHRMMEQMAAIKLVELQESATL